MGKDDGVGGERHRWGRGRRTLRWGKEPSEVEEHRGAGGPYWSCASCVGARLRARAGSTPAAYPHTGVEAGGDWPEKRKGRRRWPRGRRSSETRARDTIALQEEGEGSSGRIYSCNARGVGCRGMAPQRSVAGVVRRCRSGERSEE